MKNLVLILLTAISVLGHPVVTHARALSCQAVFAKGPARVSHSIETPLTALRDSLHELRQLLKAEIKPNGDVLSPLKDLAADPRELSYLLQGSYRLLLEHPQAKVILSKKQRKKLKEGLAEMKWLEKNLGQYQNAKELAKTASKIGAPADFVEYLTQKKNRIALGVRDQLQKSKFLDEELSRSEMLLAELQGMKKLDLKTTETYVPESLQSEILRVKEKVDLEMKALILSKKYGYHELEEGAHAFRRSLRWLKVYILAYRDHFTLQKSPYKLGTQEQALIEKYQAKEELQLNPDGKIPLREVDYYLLVEMIAQLRKIKAPGELRENLIQSLTEFGQWNGKPVTPEQAVLIITPLLEAKLHDVELRTQEILRLYENRDAFQNMIQEPRP